AVPPDADQYPAHAQAQPADLPPHRRLRPLRPSAGEGRRLLVGEDRPRLADPQRGEVSFSSRFEVRRMAGLVTASRVYPTCGIFLFAQLGRARVAAAIRVL